MSVQGKIHCCQVITLRRVNKFRYLVTAYRFWQWFYVISTICKLLPLGICENGRVLNAVDITQVSQDITAVKNKAWYLHEICSHFMLKVLFVKWVLLVLCEVRTQHLTWRPRPPVPNLQSEAKPFYRIFMKFGIKLHTHKKSRTFAKIGPVTVIFYSRA
jgi:hypothetical protein